MVKGAVSALVSLADYHGAAHGRISRFVSDLMYLLAYFAERFADVGQYWYSVIQQWTPNAAEGIADVKGFVTSLVALTDYHGVSQGRISRFVADLTYLLTYFAEQLGTAGKHWYGVIAQWAPNAA